MRNKKDMNAIKVTLTMATILKPNFEVYYLATPVLPIVRMGCLLNGAHILMIIYFFSEDLLILRG